MKKHTTPIIETLQVQCKLQKYNVKFTVGVQYGPTKLIGGHKMLVNVLTCMIDTLVPLDVILSLGDTTYSIIHQALHEQYDFEERYASFAVPDTEQHRSS